MTRTVYALIAGSLAALALAVVGVADPDPRPTLTATATADHCRPKKKCPTPSPTTTAAPAPSTSTTAPAPPPTSSTTTTANANPLTGVTFWVDPNSKARAEMDRRLTAGDTYAANALRKLADRPGSSWLGGWIPRDRLVGHVAGITQAGTSTGTMPVLVLYNIPGRDCGSYSAGGLSGPAEYAGWVRDVAAGIGDRRAVVVLEPDALPGLDCLSATGQAERTGMLAAAVDTLRAGSPRAVVYLDAGHSAWHGADTMAARLRAAGVEDAHGFSLNVSNFQWTANEETYGDRLAGLVGKRYVVDTSRNGSGPWTGGEPSWCNPPGRTLGPPPTSAPHSALADAYLWVKTTGESDGACRPGEPSSGTWWPEYAIDIAARTP